MPKSKSSVSLSSYGQAFVCEIQRGEMEEILHFAREGIRASIQASKDMSTFDWDSANNSDDLIDKWQEYLRLRHLEDIATTLIEWTENIEA